jgi:hypothetical protein
VYIADTNNNVVRMANARTGVMTTVAGTLNSAGTPGASFGGDGGPATAALLFTPAQVALDGSGNLFIADANNNAVRVVYAAGNISNLPSATPGYIYTVIGGPGKAALPSNGDGGLATSANLNFPTGVTVDSSGDIYVADQNNQAVRRVDAVTGNISSVYSGPDKPVTLSVDAADDIYFTLHTSCTVAQYNPTTQVSGTSPVTMVVAGDGTCTASGDGGAATAAGFSATEGAVVDAAGNINVLEADGVRQVAASQSALNFATQNVGTVSTAQTVFITNDDILQAAGTSNYQLLQGLYLNVQAPYNGIYGPAPFGTVPYTSANANIFDCDGVTSSGNQVGLTAGQVCGGSLVFEPYAAGTPVTYASSGSVSIVLTGTGTGSGPTATLTGTPVNFTSVVNETTSAPQLFTLTNTGSVAMLYEGIYFSAYDGFGESDTCQTMVAPGFSYPSLAPGASCTISVTFGAAAIGNRSAVMYVSDTATTGGGMQSVTLTGTGTAPVGTWSPSPLTLSAGPGSTATQTLTFSNTGSATLHYDQYSFTITGNEPNEFAIAQNLCITGTLAPGASCALQVTFTPPNYDYYTAQVNVLDDSGGVRSFLGQLEYITQNATLHGATGNPIQGNSLSVGNAVFPATGVGANVTQTVTLTLGRAASLMSVAMASGFTEYSIGLITGCMVDGTTINAAGTICEVPMTFAPAGPGVRNATLAVVDVESGVRLTYTFGLTGSGTGPIAVLTPGIISTVVGSAHGYGDGIVGADGPAVNALVGFTGGFAMDAAGQMYMADTQNAVIWKTDPTGNIHIYAGSPLGIYAQYIGGDGGTAVGAGLSYVSPMPLALDVKGGLFVGDNTPISTQASEIRYVDGATNLITNYAGFTYPALWSANTALNPTTRIVVTLSGTKYLFVSITTGTTGSTQPTWPTTPNLTVGDGTVTWQNQGVYDGGPGCAGQTDALGDGCLASQAIVQNVAGMVLDASGNLYFTDTGTPVQTQSATLHSMIRRIDAVTKMVTRVAGGETYGYSPDGTQATQAQISAYALTMDPVGNLYFADYGGTILRVLNKTSGAIYTVAGSTSYAYPYQLESYCSAGYGDGGPQFNTGFAYISDIQLDPAGDIYVVDQYGCHVRRIDAANGTIVNVAGAETTYSYINQGFGDLGQNNSDGNATGATMNEPAFMRLDALGNMYIASAFGGVRKVDVTQSVMNFAGSGSTTFADNYQNQDTASTALTTTVLNGGNSGAVTFASPFISTTWGISSTNFTRDISSPTGNADCYAVGYLTQGNECPVNVDFTPLTTGWLTGVDTVNDNAAARGGAQPITLIGYGNGPGQGVTLVPSLLTLTSPQGGSRSNQLTLFNNSVNPITVSSVAISGAAAADFVATSDCPTPLTAGSNCGVFVTFNASLQPNAASPLTLQATITVTDTAGTQTSGLIGLATLPAVSGSLTINETIHVSDSMPAVVVPTPLTMNETIHVSDSMPSVAVPMPLTISETIHVSDSMPVGGSVLAVPINETIHVSDNMPAVMDSLVVPINEIVHVSDAMPSVAAALLVPINETIHVSDAATAPAANLYGTHTSLTASASTVASGSTVMLTATVVPSGTTTGPTGSVSFYEDGSLLGMASLSAEAATYTTAGLTAGSHAFVAIYAGASTFAGSTSASVTVVATALNVLTVTANSASRAFNMANPTFGYQVTGFVNGDTSAVLSGVPLLSTTATLNSVAGGYPIVVAQGTLTAPSNYAFNFVPGTLTVTGSIAQTIQFLPLPASLSQSFGTITVTAHSTSGLPIVYQVTGPATLSGYTLTFTGTGTVTVTATQAGNSTFAPATAVVRSFTVTP